MVTCSVIADGMSANVNGDAAAGADGYDDDGEGQPGFVWMHVKRVTRMGSTFFEDHPVSMKRMDPFV